MNRSNIVGHALVASVLVLPAVIGLLGAAAPPPSVDAAEVAKVVLLDPGAEPRQPLRLQVKTGDAAVLDMTMVMSMTMAGMPSPAMPPMLTAMDLSVTDVSAAGDITTRFECTKAELGEGAGADPRMVERLRQGMGSMVGMKGTSVTTNRGIVKSAGFDVPADADPATRQQLEGMKKSLHQASCPLPEEPVGVGAKWKVESRVTVNGVTTDQTAIYTLKRRDGDILDLDMQLNQQAKEQDVQLPQGAGSMKLKSLNSTGSGTMTTSLRSIAPTRVNMTTKSDMAMEMDLNGQKQPLNQSINMTITMSSKPKP